MLFLFFSCTELLRHFLKFNELIFVTLLCNYFGAFGLVPIGEIRPRILQGRRLQTDLGDWSEVEGFNLDGLGLVLTFRVNVARLWLLEELRLGL